MASLFHIQCRFNVLRFKVRISAITHMCKGNRSSILTTNSSIMYPNLANISLLCSHSHSFIDNKKARNHTKFGELVYEGPLTRGVKALKTITLTTSGIALLLQPIIWLKNISSSGDDAAFTDIPIMLIIFSLISFIPMLTPIPIHYFTRHYVNEIYWHKAKNEMTAVMWTLLFRKKFVTFNPASVIHGSPLAFVTCAANNGKDKLFVMPESFKSEDARITFMNKHTTYDDFRKQKEQELILNGKNSV